VEARELWKPAGEVIRRLRAERGWSRNELALRAGLSPHTVGRAERGVALFPSTLRIIADALETPIDALCSERTSPEQDPVLLQRIGVVRRILTAFDEAFLRRDPELLRQVFLETCHDDFLFSCAATQDHSDGNAFRRDVAATVQHVGESMHHIKREIPYQIDEIRPFGTGQIIATGVDRVWDIASNKLLTIAVVHLFTFRDERLISIQQSAEFLASSAS
jgi:transcriptional regulator with XRE-family HTH domain